MGQTRHRTGPLDRHGSELSICAIPREKVRPQSPSLRQFPCAVNSPTRLEAPRNANVRAVHAPKLLTELPSPEPEIVSLRAIFSKALDCAKTVRNLKPLNSGGYLVLEIRTFGNSFGWAREPGVEPWHWNRWRFWSTRYAAGSFQARVLLLLQTASLTCALAVRIHSAGSILGEKVLVETFELKNATGADAHTVLDHQLGQPSPIDENHALRNPGYEFNRLGGERGRRGYSGGAGALRSGRPNAVT